MFTLPIHVENYVSRCAENHAENVLKISRCVENVLKISRCVENHVEISKCVENHIENVNTC